MPINNRGNNEQTLRVIEDYSDVKKHIKNGVLVIPESVERVNGWALSDCNKFQKVVIGENVRTLGPYAFSGCHCLKEVYIPSEISAIEQYCFTDCKHIEKFVMPINKYMKASRIFAYTIEKMKYVYQVKGDNRFYFSFNPPTEENVESVVNLTDLNGCFKSRTSCSIGF